MELSRSQRISGKRKLSTVDSLDSGHETASENHVIFICSIGDKISYLIFSCFTQFLVIIITRPGVQQCQAQGLVFCP